MDYDESIALGRTDRQKEGLSAEWVMTGIWNPAHPGWWHGCGSAHHLHVRREVAAVTRTGARRTPVVLQADMPWTVAFLSPPPLHHLAPRRGHPSAVASGGLLRASAASPSSGRPEPQSSASGLQRGQSEEPASPTERPKQQQQEHHHRGPPSRTHARPAPSRRAFLAQCIAAAAGTLLAPGGARAQRFGEITDFEDGEELGVRPGIPNRLLRAVVPQADGRHGTRPPSAHADPRVRVLIFEKPEDRDDDDVDDDDEGEEVDRLVPRNGAVGPDAAADAALEHGKATAGVHAEQQPDENTANKAHSAGARVQGTRRDQAQTPRTDHRRVRKRPRDYNEAVLIDEEVPLRTRFNNYLQLAAVFGSVAASVAVASAISERAAVSRANAVPLEYDRKAIAHYCMVRPERVVLRLTKFACEIARYGTIVAWHAILDGLKSGGERAADIRLRLRARKLREGITRLGPGVIKLGQAAATRPDLFGNAFARELQLLQDSILGGFSSKEVFALIREELGAPAEMLFEHIDPEPVAGASLGTVFKATLANDASWRDRRRRWRRERLEPDMLRPPHSIHQLDLQELLGGEESPAMASMTMMPPLDGLRTEKLHSHASDNDRHAAQYVAVKVQRPNVAEMMTLDFFIVRRLAELAGALFNVRTDLGDVVDEYASSVFEELNYLKEAANMQRFRSMYEDMPALYVPEVFPLYSSRRVLVTEWIDGEKLIDQNVHVRREDIAITVTGIRNALTQFLDGGFTHCDLHNGNILRLRDTNQLAFIDFGICASMPEYTRQSMACAIMHLIDSDYYALAASFAGMSLMLASDLDEELPVLAEALHDEFENVGQDIASDKMSSSDAVRTNVAEEDGFAFADTHVHDCVSTMDAPGDGSTRGNMQPGGPTPEYGQWEHPTGLDRHFSFIGVAEKLIKLSGQFPLKFGDYFLSNLKCLAMLEGLALKADPDFKVLDIVYPFVVSKVLTDPALPFEDARHELILDVTGRVRMESLERLVRTRNACGLRRQTEKRGATGGKAEEGPCAVIAFVLSRDGRLVRREVRRQFVADWCALANTWFDRHVFRRWDLPAGVCGGRRSWWWSSSRASAARRHDERAVAVRSISRARDNGRSLRSLLHATRSARFLRRVGLAVGLVPAAARCALAALVLCSAHVARRSVGVLARAVGSAAGAIQKLWLSV
jgi:predicted unusual protein kinase regulating ubiquinone biosynthesis (AarF/ABC1/UbiB family)